ncbi:hypothetical protein SAY86_002577 [Trapa natans]|uniref:WEB family protein n=1 Tax=Trapa natans TaxID=22666 RepID=A0AAN7LQJ8_TRANT|nr:hypothetical protein SAY86_002577 [Trapa natans]
MPHISRPLFPFPHKTGDRHRESIILSNRFEVWHLNNPSTASIGDNPQDFKLISFETMIIHSAGEISLLGDSRMQQNLAQLEEELQFLKDQLSSTEEERDWALNELKQARKEADDANQKLQEAITPRKVPGIYTELNSVKKLLTNANFELKTRENELEALRIDAKKAKQLEQELKKLNDEVAGLMDSKAEAENERTHEMEEELPGCKETDSKVLESLKTVEVLKESKNEVLSLQEKFERFEGSASTDISSRNYQEDDNNLMEAIESLTSELQSAKESEKQALMKAQNLLGEIRKLRNELKSANDAEENSKKAMDDLALALKEVATESTEVKLKLNLALGELEHRKGEAENVKAKAKNAEEKYKAVLDGLRKENEMYKNTAERLRQEAEESLLAWNDKETMFVGCIRRAEEEKALAQQENIRLVESIRTADSMVRTSKEENFKLRDILKQAINEANVAKEAANIARNENSQLKDCMSEKDKMLDFLSREIEILRANEIAAMENIKELKRLIAEASSPHSEGRDTPRKFHKQSSMEKDQSKDGRRLGKAFSFNLKDLRIHTKHRDMDSGEENNNNNRIKDGECNKSEETNSEEDPELADPLKGSIFDAVDDSPGSACHHRRKSSLVFTSDGEVMNPEELDHLEAAHFDDLENGRFSSRRRNRLLKRFGDLLIRRRSSCEIKHR